MVLTDVVTAHVYVFGYLLCRSRLDLLFYMGLCDDVFISFSKIHLYKERHLLLRNQLP